MCARSTRRRCLAVRRAGTGLLACALAVALPIAGLAAAEQKPSDANRAAEVGLGVSVGYDGRTPPGVWTPVEVTLQPSRMVAGTLAVETRGTGGVLREEREVEVGTGSRTSYRFLASDGDVSVRLREAGRPPLVVRPRRAPDHGEFLVGTLGPAPADAPALRSDPLGVSATWVGVDPSWIELSPASLEPLGALVADRAALTDLSAHARRNLVAAVAAGTDLVVVAVRDGPLALEDLGLPWTPATAMATTTVEAGDDGPVDVASPEGASSAWVLDLADVLDSAASGTAVAAAAPAGRGRVTVVGAAPGEGLLGRSSRLWSALVGPGRRPVEARSGWSADSQPHQFSALLAEPGGGPPALPWLAAFILVYVAVVGPVNAVVLGRLRRRELAWVTVPLVTAVFTGAAFLGAVGGRPPVGVAAQISAWVDGTASETVLAGVRGPTPGRHQIAVPGTDWTVRTVTGRQEPAIVRRDGDLHADLDLAALQPGGVVARRAVTAPAPLAVDAVAGPDGVEVTVTNTGGTAIDGVAVRTATATRAVGDLRPGASATTTLGRTRLTSIDPWDPGPGMRGGPGEALGLPRSLETLLRGDVMDGNPGLVWAVGTTPAGAPGVRVDGRRARDGGVVVAVAERPLLPGDASVTAHAVDRALVGGGQHMERPGPLAVGGGGEAHLRFRLPPGGAVPVLYETLADHGPAEGGHIEVAVWDHTDRQWTTIGEAFGADGGDPARLVDPLGQVWVRARGDLFPYDYSAAAVMGVDPDGGPR